MKYRVWYSTEAFANYIIDHTNLKSKELVKKKMYESDANNSKNFHSMPDHIKKILYLDAPDLIVEINHEPIFSIEISTEAGTGHNVFQRFARLAASVENNVPAFYIYPEAKIINRKHDDLGWDRINPLIFKALDHVMSIYHIPALLYYFPSDYRQYPNAIESPNIKSKGLIFDKSDDYASSPSSQDDEMKNMFNAINEVIAVFEENTIVEGRGKLLGKYEIKKHKFWMSEEFCKGQGSEDMSPLSATVEIPTEYLINYLNDNKMNVGELIRSRDKTILYKVNASFRGDPYTGALAAIDYLRCREGTTFEERKYNLVLVWANVIIDQGNKTIKLIEGKASVNDFINDVKKSEDKNILGKEYNTLLKNNEIPRYYMQVRYGSTYSKSKHIRVFSYFADAILFTDGALWRDA
jgi:hypothetical protein